MFSFLVAIALYVSYMPSDISALFADIFPRAIHGLPTAAAAEAKPQAPIKKDEYRLGIETSARSAMVMDWETGELLFAKDVDTPRSIASISKLMTAIVVQSMGVPLDTIVEMQSEDMRAGGMIFVSVGEQVTVRDLLYISLVGSGNSETVALARATGLSEIEFMEQMNKTALDIGLTKASFTEPTGLSAQNIATAKDVATLLRHAFKDPIITHALGQESYEFTTQNGSARRVRSTDMLIGSALSRPPYALLGGKTGFITDAGYCFVAAAENGEGNKIIAVALGTPNREARFTEVKNLMFWTFDAYAWPSMQE